MSWWEVYLFTRLDGINTFLGVLCALSCIACIVSFIVTLACDPEKYEKRPGYEEEYRDSKRTKDAALLVFKGMRWVAPVLIAITILIPTQKEASAIYLLPKITNNKSVQQIPGLAADLLKDKLEEWIADVSPEKRERPEPAQKQD